MNTKPKFGALTPVDSKNVHSFGYHVESRTLRIKFHTGSTFDYLDVPAEIASAFVVAKSKGGYVAAHIRGKYKTEGVAADFTDEPRPPIELHPVKSSQIKAVGYDPDTETLAMQFVAGSAIYHYPGVTAELHKALLAAESIGVFFGRHIKPLAFKKYRADPVAA